jgi:DNA mismatch repair protein MutL
MGKINVLSSALASQIAAGEVVERPASALKELLENALDAGATRCDVEIEGGGITRLSVRDDGEGMTPEDAALCVERHATSKLVRVEDLSRLGSYGFRGEALPSIASVSRLTIETRPAHAELGTRVHVEAGAAAETTTLGMAVGTRVQISDLFFNVPARRKFLRSSGTEAGHISDVLEAAALSAPQVTFTLERDGRKAREWLRAADRGERVRSAFEDEQLIHCEGQRGPLSLEAFVGRPERARLGAAGLRLFCNGRPIRDRAVLNTIAQAYGSVLERGRYPRGVVYLELPPELVDVNVHPQKTEVRFADTRALTDAVYDLLSRQLASALSLPPAAQRRWAPRQSAPLDGPRATDADVPGVTVPPLANASAAGVRPTSSPDFGANGSGGEVEPPVRPNPGWEAPDTRPRQQSLLRIEESTNTDVARLDGYAVHPARAGGGEPRAREAEVSWRKLRFVAQVRATYLICEAEEGLYVLDQHAAAERVHFHRLKKEYGESKMASQALLFPVTLSVTSVQRELIQEHEPDITRFGFDVQVHAEDTVSIQRVPRLLQRESSERLFRDLLAELSRAGRGYSAAVDAALSTLACHTAVRAGDALDERQANALLRDLEGVDFAAHCPHGRPIVAFTSWSELERKVGRR